MIRANDLISLFKQTLNEKWGYIWGGAGQTWTQAKQDAATREMTVKYGSKWIGQRVADCSGLFVWAFRTLGGSIYHGSNTIWAKYCAQRGELKNGIRTDGQTLKPGTALFLKKTENGSANRHHIGLYIGGGTVIEAKGTVYGVVTSEPAHWHEWGELKAVLYEGSNTDMDKNTTIQRGGKGALVLKLQTLLLEAGCALPRYGADGDFGQETENAVRQYQAANKLNETGVCDKAMWDMLAGHGTNAPATDDAQPTEGDAEAEFNTLLDALETLVEQYRKQDKTEERI